MKIKLLGIRMHGRLYLSGLERSGMKMKKIPPYFTVEIETDSIKSREKGKSYKKKEAEAEGKND